MHTSASPRLLNRDKVEKTILFEAVRLFAECGYR